MKISQTLLGVFSIAAAFCLPLAPLPASGAAVSLELALVVDESGSVDNAEWLLQRNGYVQAFQDPVVQAAIMGSLHGGIAVTYIQFDAQVQQHVSVGWTHINSMASANSFANAILALPRFGNNGTGVRDAINFTYQLFGNEVTGGNNGFESVRQIIDVSGDGRNNQNENMAQNATDLVTTAAIAAGIDRINGVVINPAGEMGLLAFYQTQVQDGPGSFTVVADDFGDFAAAIRNKIIVEVVGVPEGGATILYSLLSIAALGFFALRRKSALA